MNESSERDSTRPQIIRFRLTMEITDLKESVLFITNQYEYLKKDMQEKFIDVKQLKEENDCLKSTVKDLNSRLSIMEQHSRMSNLEIQCVPEHRTEKPVRTVVGANAKECALPNVNKPSMAEMVRNEGE
ncbi:unnamed protein product [Parnassius apollo]|uniref:(apollo) hypothetical protein n=1 Tax=Parnassius apollo TaxID=110799 RepID=A0A8S3Y9R2_PARAO|nr:unnamed protein product [Parnassius apollo]